MHVRHVWLSNSDHYTINIKVASLSLKNISLEALWRKVGHFFCRDKLSFFRWRVVWIRQLIVLELKSHIRSCQLGHIFHSTRRMLIASFRDIKFRSDYIIHTCWPIRHASLRIWGFVGNVYFIVKFCFFLDQTLLILCQAIEFNGPFENWAGSWWGCKFHL